VYFTANVITGIKSSSEARAVHVLCMEEIQNPLNALVGNSKRKRQLKETGAYIKNVTSTVFMNILASILRSGYRTVYLIKLQEPSDFMKGMKFLDWRSNYKILKKNFGPFSLLVLTSFDVSVKIEYRRNNHKFCFVKNTLIN
jgi:hypothetical protein